MMSFKRRTLLGSLLVLVAFGFGLSTALAGMEERPALMAKLGAAKGQIAQVTVTQAKAMMDTTKGLVVVDVRTTEEWNAGHLPGAMHLDRGKLEFAVEKAIKDKGTPILVYCKSGGRGSLATLTLKEMGYSNVTNMAGGFVGWQKAGLPVVKPS